MTAERNDSRVDVADFVDLHVHIGPEILPRKYTVESLIPAQRERIGGLALKNHFYPTTSLIQTVDQSEELQLIGSVTLNRFVGGLNPAAVHGTAIISELPVLVWFPTINAANDLAESEYEIPPEWVGFTDVSGGEQVDPDEIPWLREADEVDGISVSDGGDLTEDARAVLTSIRDHGAVLCTGHLSSAEAELLVEEAVEMGVEQVVLTHPIYDKIAMPIDVQRKLVRHDNVYVEHNYAMHLIDDIPIADIAEQIDAVGPSNCILSTDVGQPSNPDPDEALSEFATELHRNGLEREDLRTMGVHNPRAILGIE